LANIVKADSVKTSFVFLGEHCEIKVVFLDKVANAPVTVVNPSFKIKDSAGNDINLRILKPLTPMGNQDGLYHVTFLTTNGGLTTGTFDLVFTGYYPDNTKEDNKLEIKSSIEVFAVDTIQTKMDMLKRKAHDHIAQAYEIDNPEEFKFDDGDLYSALKQATDRWNEEPPVTVHPSNLEATIENAPFPQIQMDFAECYLLRPEIILEIWNTIQYSDQVTFNINRAPMLQSLMQATLNDVTQRIKLVKKDWVWRNTSVHALKSSKLPLRALRQISMTPQLGFISSGGY